MNGTPIYVGDLAWLSAGLRGCQAEIEESISAAVANGALDPQATTRELAIPHRDLVSALLESAVTSLEMGVPWHGRVPAVAALQGRQAALASIDLPVVIHGHVLTHTVFWEHLIEVVKKDGRVASQVRQAVRVAARSMSRALLSHALSAMAEGYMHGGKDAKADGRQLELVKTLLAGDRPPASEDYPIDAAHVGLVWFGQDIGDLVTAAAHEVDGRLLIVRHLHDTAWVWISARNGVDAAAVTRLLVASAPDNVRVGVGEAGRDAGGFRLTHRQANAALAVANLSVRRVIQYADVTLLAHALQDDTLAKSLIDVYLVPLGDPRAGGRVLRQTLRAYFRAGRNATAAANALRVDRSTIKSRLSLIEECLGRARYAQQAELEVALALEQLRSSGTMEWGV